MYASYFGLKHEPFSIAPDPRYLFMSERHREALAHLLFGLAGGGGFVLLTGEVGTGKTTVCRCFLEQIPADCNVAYIFNPKLTVIELLQSICDEFHIAVTTPAGHAPTVKNYLDPLNDYLLKAHAAGRNSVLIIDEAQNLSADVLEQLRLLTNLETSERKLLQVILIGQPQLREMVARPELEQLAQRIIARYHLGPLTPAETGQYIRHRLAIAGLDRPLPFDGSSLLRIHQLARGIPRRINVLCDRALLGAFALGKAIADRKVVDAAAAEVFGKGDAAPSTWRRSFALLVAGIAVGAGLFAVANRWLPAAERQVAAAPAKAAGGPPKALDAASAPVVTRTPEPAPKPATAAAETPGTLLKSPAQAWRELAQLWKADAGGGDPCRTLARQQVQCFSRNLSLPLIQQLNRPGVITLDAHTATPSYALLTALTADSATLRADGIDQTVTLTALGERWRGDFATLWRQPPGYAEATAPGPETIAWVETQLTRAKLGPADAANSGATRAARLRSFQVAQGLVPDGALGPLTFMQLNRVGGVDEPRLRTTP